ncbi:predicted protein [Sclerotinia sclerotiorum 1980 UF-70]|uniref:Uncharacterized protein n=2 Tax=Sclerotinia sclerotiorum (strain ATCC 18683 / 1980 / Ss-1) TaxID=665079 RepID=A0A1D9PRE4_SCLS1|nr:predicted protein [Sclerotinia sclerotiorum 1980 UF-70]APA05295.1 hypothetical protein sscle_01g000650 [Sclerotinia sclerotiorum 1980 UF-70]EDN93823.1 predicted protein [Sclerotinia sclerotiorum 1980 UF-70]
MFCATPAGPDGVLMCDGLDFNTFFSTRVRETQKMLASFMAVAMLGGWSSISTPYSVRQ